MLYNDQNRQRESDMSHIHVDASIPIAIRRGIAREFQLMLMPFVANPTDANGNPRRFAVCKLIGSDVSERWQGLHLAAYDLYLHYLPQKNMIESEARSATRQELGKIFAHLLASDLVFDYQRLEPKVEFEVDGLERRFYCVLGPHT